MHLLAAQPGGFTDDEGIIDLAQTPAQLVILSAADSSLAALSSGAAALPAQFPSVRIANWMQLLKPAAFDLYQHKVLDHAQVVVVSLLGGKNYWSYGFERLLSWANEGGDQQPRHLIFVPGDDVADPELTAASTVTPAAVQQVWRYFREGGGANIEQLFHYLGDQFLQFSAPWQPPQVLPNCMLYMAQNQRPHSIVSLADWQQRWGVDQKCQVAVLLFYRSHLQSANTEMFDGFIEIIEQQDLNPLPIAISSLRDPESLSLINQLLVDTQASIIINTTGFSCHRAPSPDLSSTPSQFDSPFVLDIPILQLQLASSTEQDWLSSTRGLHSRDMAMQVVLPEMDGRIITRAISFKAAAHYDERCQSSVIKYQLHRERAQFVAKLAANYCKLTVKSNSNKRLALIIANYPTKDGRIGNGVGLDTPQSTINILNTLVNAGYPVANIPEDGTALIKELLGAVTNNPDTLHHLPCWQSLSLSDYQQYFSQLPPANQQAILSRWGEPSQDPKCRDDRLMISGIRLDQTFVGIQPARGFNLDLAANYHDPDLVPPHSYLAFYFWLRHVYQVDAIVHVGKHGNLEWLPGNGIALSDQCWPDLVLGPMPNFYPFIVNDPGEGAQAKRRIQAVIIDHLMPPMARAELYGELAELEHLVDEYYQAMGMDPARSEWLRGKIIDAVNHSNLGQELTGGKAQSNDQMLDQLDAYLCDIKEAQIRHGLHRLGQMPPAEKLAETLVSLLRLPRGNDNISQGILHNLSADLNLMVAGKTFDPLIATSEVWQGNKPPVLLAISEASWRTQNDSRERLELLALRLIEDYVLGEQDISSAALSLDKLASDYPHTSVQLHYIKNTILAVLNLSAEQELSALLKGLSGQFIEPGPSGAPTRGRLDTLPTGRNFYSVDNRSIPSHAAWALGQKSAQALIDRHLQEHGDYPKQLGLSVWGTATMRTGGDDIAQAFALMGIKPIWAVGSQRVIDFEIVPCMLLNRPRIDVTLRVSGFFRDAFPNVMKLFDAAVLALDDYEDPGFANTISENINQRTQQLISQGLSSVDAKRQASYRVFGSKPGAYGAGLQGLIDERCWQDQADLAQAYINWGGYAYGKDASDGVEAKAAFRHQLSSIDVVVQNQDNREHDLLDSDDYYQFQGGMSNAITVLSGQSPQVYHNDHSNPSLPKIRTLKEELNRVIRSRVLNPKWISAMREHGYKGAFEFAATVDYLFAYDATTNLIDDYQYQNVADALIFDSENQQFIKDNNPDALSEMATRLLEATQRGMWQAPGQYANKLQDLLIELDESQEGS